MSFKSLGLSAPLLKAVEKQGYDTPSPIQQKAIPVILERKDVLASAQTGTGKTAGFTLPMLQILSQKEPSKRRAIRALVLTPTRELAAQVYQNALDYSAFIDFRSAVIFGGVNQNPQVRTLRQGVDLLVATPGRLLDLINQKEVSLSQVEILVLDEADRMLDMGFLRDIEKILRLLPSKRQSLLFSATFSKEIKVLAQKFLHNPVLVEATPENTTVEKINQKVIKLDAVKKPSLLVKLIKEGDWYQVLVFTRTKHGANKLSQKLEKQGISSAAIHGNKSQGARTKALAGFKAGEINVLVATDIAARGLDIPLLPHVVNYELPNVPEDYVHRIGRTGRAGAKGEAISFVSQDENTYLRDIEKLVGEQIEEVFIDGYEQSNDYVPKPKQGQRQFKPKSERRSSGGNSGGFKRRPQRDDSKPSPRRRRSS